MGTNPPRGPTEYFSPGDWNALCSMCGRQMKASMMVKNWMGAWRCPEHDEMRQPQDFAKGELEYPVPPFTQDPPDNYILVCSPAGSSASPGYATPGCMIPGQAILPAYALPPIP